MNKYKLNWYSFTGEELEKLLRVKLSRGLTGASALARSAINGKLPEAAKDKTEPLTRLLYEFGEIVSYIPLPLCAFLCVLGMIFGEDYGCGITLTVICAFTVVTALVRLVFPNVADNFTGRNAKDEIKVVRRGVVGVISPDMLVPGDVVILSERDIVPCDIRLFDCESMYVMELFSDNEYRKYRPVAKNSAVIVQGDNKLPERMWKNVVFKGSVVTSGGGIGVVIDPDLTLEEAVFLLQRPIIEGFEAKKLAVTPVAIPFFARISALKDSPEAVSHKEKLKREGRFFAEQRENTVSLLSIIQIAAAVFVFSLGVLCGADVFGIFFFSTLVMAFPADTVTSVAMQLAFCVGAIAMSKEGISVKSFESAEKMSCAEAVFCKKKSLYRVKSVVPEKVIMGRRVFEAGSYYKNELAPIFTYACYCSDLKIKNAGSKKTVTGDADEICNPEFAVRTGMVDKNNVFGFVTGRKEIRTPDGVLEGVIIPRSDKQTQDVAVIRGKADSIIPKCTMFDSGTGNAPIDPEAGQYISSMVHESEADDCHVATAIAVKSLSGSDDSLTSGFTLVGVIVYKVNFADDSADAVASCRSIGIDPVFFTPDISAGITESAKRAGVLAYNDKQIDSIELSMADDERFFSDIDSYRLFAGLSDEQKRAVIYARKRRGEIVASCADSLRDIKCAVEADVMISTGDVAPTLKKHSDIHLAREGFSSVASAIEGSRRILKGAALSLRYCFGAVTCIVAALVLMFLWYCLAGRTGAFGVSAASPMPAPILAVLLFIVVPVTTVASALVSIDTKRIMSDIPDVFIDKLSSFASGAYKHIVFACISFSVMSLVSMLVSFALDSDPDSAALAAFITMSVACMLMAVSTFKQGLYSRFEKLPGFFYGVLGVLVLFCIWLCVSYTPASFSAEFGIFKIGYPTLLLSFLCALVIPVACEMRKSIIAAKAKGGVRNERARREKGIAQKQKVVSEKNAHKSEKAKNEVAISRNKSQKTDEKLEKTNTETQDLASESLQKGTNDEPSKVNQPGNEAPHGKNQHKSDEKSLKKAQALAKKAAEKKAKRDAKEKKHLEKQRKKDIEDGWDDLI